MDSSPRRWIKGLLLGVAVVLIALLAGGGYLLGKSSGEDLDAARSAGSAAGERAGSAQGAEQGFAEGQEQGRRVGYRTSYATAYRAAYRKAFEDAGQTPPTQITVPSASP